MWNDWLFVPGDLEAPERFFPNPALVTDGRVTMLLADNRKSPREHLEISAIDGPPEAHPGACLEAAFREARRRGQPHLHLMLPSHRAIEPFLAAGFRSWEQSLDVLLYAARTASLRLFQA